jgi:hypothetical protein
VVHDGVSSNDVFRKEPSVPHKGKPLADLRHLFFVYFQEKMTVFWNIAPCGFVVIVWRFRRTYCLHQKTMLQHYARNRFELATTQFVCRWCFCHAASKHHQTSFALTGHSQIAVFDSADNSSENPVGDSHPFKSQSTSSNHQSDVTVKTSVSVPIYQQTVPKYLHTYLPFVLCTYSYSRLCISTTI